MGASKKLKVLPAGEKFEDEAIAKYEEGKGLLSVRPQTNRLKHRKAAFLLALKKSFGNVSQAAALTQIGRTCHYEWMNADPAYKTKVEDVDEIVVDFYESQANKRVAEGSDNMIQFMLKNKGKKRGYQNESSRIELPPGANAIPVTINEVRLAEGQPIPKKA